MHRLHHVPYIPFLCTRTLSSQSLKSTLWSPLKASFLQHSGKKVESHRKISATNDLTSQGRKRTVSLRIMPAASLQALLTKSIDYAGMFPPCSLALEPALDNQAQYVSSCVSCLR